MLITSAVVSGSSIRVVSQKERAITKVRLASFFDNIVVNSNVV